ncbi:OmpH family outer membrane protein [Jiulongibacter sp. NS-SX5]|uniref:OmpH family outer membrane protein n=1 Tax=Jiulongibacter sp. NS-SX5 TaxID=3463854 RepID=UPI0040593BC5
MKKSLFFLFLSLISVGVYSQKFGYIDSEFITSKMPEYQDAMKAMNTYSDQWIKDIETKHQEVSEMKRTFEQEEILLTEDMKKERLADIAQKELEVKNLNNSIFGLEGQLFLKKKELMKPVMDAIYTACEKVARQKKLMFIFDKASDISMIYTDPRHDYTDYVMEELGIVEKK